MAAARALLGLGAWFGALLAVLSGLLAAGDRLPPPPVTDLGALGDWATSSDPIVAGFSAVRLVAIAVVAYLLVATTASVVATLVGSPHLARAVAGLVHPAVHRAVVRRLLGSGLAVSLASSVALTAGWARPAPAAVVAVPDDAEAPPDTGAGAGATPDRSRPVLVDLGAGAAPAAPSGPAGPSPPADAGGTIRPADAGATSPEPDGATPAAALAGLAPGRHVIAPGDHLWGVAEATLTAWWGRPPSSSATAAYLDRLVAANRDVLAVPGDPDLVFPGQVVTLPTVPPAP